MPVAEGFHTLAPYLLIADAEKAVEFYKKAFDAEQLLYLEAPDGGLIHAEIKIGDSPVMIGDPTTSAQYDIDTQVEEARVYLFLYVDDVDTFIERAVATSAKMIMAPQDLPNDGDRRGGIKDPFGFTWFVATQIKPITREQLQQQYDEQK